MMRTLLGSFLSLALLAGGGTAGDPRPERDGLLKSLERHRAKGDLKRACHVARKAIELFPDDAGMHVRYQDIRRALGEQMRLRSEYQSRRAREPDSALNLCLYARLLRGAAAEREYRRAIKLEPTCYLAHFGLGVNAMEAGRWKEARGHFERARSVAPASPEPFLRLGQIHERSGDDEAALTCYEAAEKVAPHDFRGTFHRALLLAALSRPAEARRAAERILRHGVPRALTLGHIALGVAAAAGKKHDRAGEEFQRAVRLSEGKGAHALTFLANTLVDLGRIREAQDSYQKALRQDPAHDPARLGLGYLLYREGDVQRADALFKRVLDNLAKRDLSPSERRVAEADPLFFRGLIAEALGRYARAERFYRDALNRDPTVTDYALTLAAFLERAGRKRDALALYKRVLKQDPKDALACLQAGLIERERKQGVVALELFREAVRRDPKLLDAYLAAGVTCQDLLRRPGDARLWYRRYLERGGDHPEVEAWLRELD